jgi:hypothetical protein
MNTQAFVDPLVDFFTFVTDLDLTLEIDKPPIYMPPSWVRFLQNFPPVQKLSFEVCFSDEYALSKSDRALDLIWFSSSSLAELRIDSTITPKAALRIFRQTPCLVKCIMPYLTANRSAPTTPMITMEYLQELSISSNTLGSVEEIIERLTLPSLVSLYLYEDREDSEEYPSSLILNLINRSGCHLTYLSSNHVEEIGPVFDKIRDVIVELHMYDGLLRPSTLKQMATGEAPNMTTLSCCIALDAADDLLSN